MTDLTLISVVDDDESVRESLPDLLRTLGYEARAYASAGEFLRSSDLDESKCLILDVAMPEMSGPELQKELRRRQNRIPIIFITAHADQSTRPQLIEEGASDCLAKPFSDTALIDALKIALNEP
jgi:FixJ family two-component response regulator